MSKFDKLDGTTIVVRFIFGALLGGFLVLVSRPWRPMPTWLAIALPVTIGVLTVLFGDTFVEKVLRRLRWFR